MSATSQEGWQEQHDGQPLRLLITRRVADAIWTIPYDIVVKRAPRPPSVY